MDKEKGGEKKMEWKVVMGKWNRERERREEGRKVERGRKGRGERREGEWREEGRGVERGRKRSREGGGGRRVDRCVTLDSFTIGPVSK